MLGILNFFGNLRKDFKERNALVHENTRLKRELDRVMQDLAENIKNAETENERKRLVALRQQIIDEGKRIRDEAKKNQPTR